MVRIEKYYILKWVSPFLFCATVSCSHYPCGPTVLRVKFTNCCSARSLSQSISISEGATNSTVADCWLQFHTITLREWTHIKQRVPNIVSTDAISPLSGEAAAGLEDPCFCTGDAEMQTAHLPLAQDWIFTFKKLKSCKGKYIGCTEKIIKPVFIPRKN